MGIAGDGDSSERVFHLDRPISLMYLKLSVAGHLTIFLTRTRGPFWSIRPARILWAAVLGTQIVASLIAVYGLFMTPLGWKWAGLVWAYALAWFLVNDRVKLLAYKIFDPIKTNPNPEDKVDSKPEDKTAAPPQPKAKTSEPPPEAKAADAPKPESTTAPKAEAPKNDPKPEAKAEPQPQTKVSDTKPEPKPETKPAASPQPATKAGTSPDVRPDIIKRVHELYEQLGREDVQAVEEKEKAERDAQKNESHK